ncbi:MAG: hypothetical protein ACI9DS_001257, partial [Glaciecola sp.]
SDPILIGSDKPNSFLLSFLNMADIGHLPIAIKFVIIKDKNNIIQPNILNGNKKIEAFLMNSSIRFNLPII